jgi:hypothetical protein
LADWGAAAAGMAGFREIWSKGLHYNHGDFVPGSNGY